MRQHGESEPHVTSFPYVRLRPIMDTGLTSAGWQITVEDVRGGFPLAADLAPDDHILAGVGLRRARGRNRKSINSPIESHIAGRRNNDLLRNEGQIEAG